MKNGKLVLSRKRNEVIVISVGGVEQIRIHALDDCKLAFDGPKDIQVDRLEVWASKQGKKVA